MTLYRAISHYSFKKGKEAQGLKFLETEVVKISIDCGGKDTEILIDEKNPTRAHSTAIYDDLSGSNQFQSLFEAKKNEFLEFCTEMPRREIWAIHKRVAEKGKKAA